MVSLRTIPVRSVTVFPAMWRWEMALMIGVFNDNAYNNLVSQVRAAGFQLDMEGNEDIYTNGSYYIACNKNYRTVRITKVS